MEYDDNAPCIRMRKTAAAVVRLSPPGESPTMWALLVLRSMPVAFCIALQRRVTAMSPTVETLFL